LRRRGADGDSGRGAGHHVLLRLAQSAGERRRRRGRGAVRWMNQHPKLPGFFRLTRLASVPSTSEEAKRLAREGAPEGALITALEQTAGHGRQGRAWFSPPGNFYVSAVLRPDCDAAQAAQLGFAAALAVGEACAGFLPKSATLAYKWPNDVLLGARKAAGIL